METRHPAGGGAGHRCCELNLAILSAEMGQPLSPGKRTVSAGPGSYFGRVWEMQLSRFTSEAHASSCEKREKGRTAAGSDLNDDGEQPQRPSLRQSAAGTPRRLPCFARSSHGVLRAAEPQSRPAPTHATPFGAPRQVRPSATWRVRTAMFALAAISFAVVAHALAARGPLHSLPEDPFAFPKYRVSFLNGHPVLNETADKWLRDGLRGGDLEFLDQPWHEVHWDRSQKLREIGSGQEGSSEQVRRVS